MKAHQIIAAMRKKGYTLVRLSQETGISQPRLSKWSDPKLTHAGSANDGITLYRLYRETVATDAAEKNESK